MKWMPSFMQRKSAEATYTFGTRDFAAMLARVFGGGATKSGASVNTDTAMLVSTVFCCVRVIAEGVAQVPFRVMLEKPGATEGSLSSRLPQRKHALFDLLHRRPNRWQTSFAFRETLMMHILLGPTGSAYAYKNRVGANKRLRDLILIPPNRVREEIGNDGSIVYHVTAPNGTQRELQEDDVWHIRGPSWDGQTSIPILRMAREAVGLAMATEETQALLHKNGVRSSGHYSVEGNLSQPQQANLTAWIMKNFGGANSGTPMVLDRNAKWTPHTMNGVDAQHLETRKHQVAEICRFYRVLPIMVMENDKASTYASVEQMLIAHLVHTLLTWYERLEQSADVFLLTEDERAAGYYTHLDPKGMLRGALKDTAEFLAKLTGNGTMTRNEARGELDLNPLPGLDEPLTPINLVTSATNNPADATV